MATDGTGGGTTAPTSWTSGAPRATTVEAVRDPRPKRHSRMGGMPAFSDSRRGGPARSRPTSCRSSRVRAAAPRPKAAPGDPVAGRALLSAAKGTVRAVTWWRGRGGVPRSRPFRTLGRGPAGPRRIEAGPWRDPGRRDVLPAAAGPGRTRHPSTRAVNSAPAKPARPSAASPRTRARFDLQLLALDGKIASPPEKNQVAPNQVTEVTHEKVTHCRRFEAHFG